jgi:hypothetical protein
MATGSASRDGGPWVCAFGQVEPGGTFSGVGFTASRSGPGVYPIVLDFGGVAGGQATLQGADALAAMIRVDVTGALTIRTFDAAGAAADRGFSLTLYALK